VSDYVSATELRAELESTLAWAGNAERELLCRAMTRVHCVRTGGRGVTFARWNRALRLVPACVRCWLRAHLPRRIEQQAWDALADEIEKAA
jgi:hypothetical protein